MNDFNFSFDARQFTPKQGGGAHPVGNKFPFSITSVEVNPTKNNDGGMLVVELTSDAGYIKNRYNLWNANEMARNIAQQQLSALCHAVGIFQIGPQKGKELIGGKGLMDIGFQKGHEPSAEKPEGGYVELKKVYTLAGLEPGASGGAAPANNAQGNGANWGSQGNGAQQGTQQNGNPAGTQGNTGQNPSNNGQAAQTNASPSNNGGWNAGGQQSESPPWGGQ